MHIKKITFIFIVESAYQLLEPLRMSYMYEIIFEGFTDEEIFHIILTVVNRSIFS